MNWIIRKFKEWRRRPFKQELRRAFTRGDINSTALHKISSEFDRL